VQETTKVKRRKKVKKIPNATFSSPSCNRKTKSQNKISKSQVEISFQMEEKSLLEEEFLAEVPDDELQQIPEKYYPIINDGIKEFSKLLHSAVEGERRRFEIKSPDATTSDSMKRQQIETKEVSPSIEYEPSEDVPNFVSIKKQGKVSQCDLKGDPLLLRQIIWRLHWILDQ